MDGKYGNLSDLAKTMSISRSQIYRVKRGERNINQQFIIGASEAFPEYTIDQLFYISPGSRLASKPSKDRQMTE
jgi:hypothetical protein